MSSPTLSAPVVRQLLPAVRAVVVLTVLLGIAYPLLVTGIAQVTMKNQADGSMIDEGSTPVGSSLIGQTFTQPVLGANGKPKTDADGAVMTRPDPAYFQSRPSAAGTGYDPLATSASNLAPTSSDLLALVNQRRALAARLDGTPAHQVPPDALLASGSGLDPHISPTYADQQVARVASERGLDVSVVQRLVDENTEGRTLGFIGEPRVNVLELNLALDRASGSANGAD
jgi:K+-transporting ATPase ATPase C chain